MKSSVFAKCPLANEQRSKVGYIRSMGYFSALKRNEILACVTTWVDLEDMMLSEISRSQGQILCDFT